MHDAKSALLRGPSGQVVVIDDIGAALRRSGDQCRLVAEESARQVRDALRLAAAMRGWSLVVHEAFTVWAYEHLDGADVWLVLDPLFEIRPGTPKLIPARFTRVLDGQTLAISDVLPDDTRTELAGASVGILDDAAVTGETLKYVATQVRDSGGQVTECLLCVSTEKARSAFESFEVEAGWRQFVGGDHLSIHMRDACPCLPFASRQTSSRKAVLTPNGPVRVTHPPTAFRGGPWGDLSRDRSFMSVIAQARRRLADRFTAVLGREALVSDVPLLGEHASIVTRIGELPSPLAPLRSLV